jgi:hypothetical protein
MRTNETPLCTSEHASGAAAGDRRSFAELSSSRSDALTTMLGPDPGPRKAIPGRLV